MKLTEETRKKYVEIKESMLAATSPDEVNYYSNQLQKLLDEVEDNEKFSKKTMPKKDREEYEELVRSLLDATKTSEVTYYEEKIHELLDKVEQNITQ